tara:strand:- start:8 stop:283 length:276 start_codon:yes stop_codon:yes gene_type:complete
MFRAAKKHTGELIAGIPQELLRPDAIVLSGLDGAVMGYTDPGILVYSYVKMVDHFAEEGMSRDEAYEWIDFNVLGLQANGSGFLVLYDSRC